MSIDSDKTIYLTFDDGPNPDSTSWILELLEKYQAKATFFCIGKNADEYPTLFQKIINEKHQIGNHTYNHLCGLKTSTKAYIEDVERAKKTIPSNLFRPPYGKMKPKQHKALAKKGFQTVFWSHISYDFDPSLSSEKRIEIALKRTKNNAIIVFHDSSKAFPQLKKELPLLLEKWCAEGYHFKGLPLKNVNNELDRYNKL